MAAFCTCCGATITTKSERCLVCGAPRHGMGTPQPLEQTPFDQANGQSGRTAESKEKASIA